MRPRRRPIRPSNNTGSSHWCWLVFRRAPEGWRVASGRTIHEFHHFLAILLPVYVTHSSPIQPRLKA